MNSTTGAFTGTAAAFNLTSIDLSTAVGTATGYVVEGLLAGPWNTANKSAPTATNMPLLLLVVPVGAYIQTATVPFNWTDIDTFEFGYINQGTGSFVPGWPTGF